MYKSLHTYLAHVLVTGAYRARPRSSQLEGVGPLLGIADKDPWTPGPECPAKLHQQT